MIAIVNFPLLFENKFNNKKIIENSKHFSSIFLSLLSLEFITYRRERDNSQISENDFVHSISCFIINWVFSRHFSHLMLTWEYFWEGGKKEINFALIKHTFLTFEGRAKLNSWMNNFQHGWKKGKMPKADLNKINLVLGREISFFNGWKFSSEKQKKNMFEEISF